MIVHLCLKYSLGEAVWTDTALFLFVVVVCLDPNRYSFEALIALEELLPSIVILLLTSRGKGRRYPIGSPSEAMGFGVRVAV